MATIQQYLEQLQNDKQNLTTKLSEKGVEVTGDETFTQLIPKLDEIQIGEDISKYINNEITYKAVGTAIGCWHTLIKNLPSIIIPEETTSCSSMFQNYKGYSIDLSNSNTSNVTSFYGMFNLDNNLINVDMSDCDLGKSTNCQYMFDSCIKLKILRFGFDLGKSYTYNASNYKYYSLELNDSPELTYESIMSVINNLYDLNLAYDVANGNVLYTQSLKLGTANKAKLTAEEIAIATSKGWTVS